MEFREEYLQLEKNNRQLKRQRVPLNNRQIRMEFKHYLQANLNDKLNQMREDFLIINVPQFDIHNDTYIQLDINISRYLFGTIIDVDNLEAFDKYLVNYFIYNNMVIVDEYPVINIQDTTPVAKFWIEIMEEIEIKNGEKFIVFLNKMRTKKMNLISRKVKHKQQMQNMLHGLKVSKKKLNKKGKN